MSETFCTLSTKMFLIHHTEVWLLLLTKTIKTCYFLLIEIKLKKLNTLLLITELQQNYK